MTCRVDDVTALGNSMKNSIKIADKLYSDYLDSFGETVPNPNGKKPLKLTKQRFAGLYGFDTWRDFKVLIESNEPVRIAEHVAAYGVDIKRHTTPHIIDIFLSERQDVEKVLSLHAKLGNLSADVVKRYTAQDNEISNAEVYDVLIDLFTAHEPALKFNLRLKDAQFIVAHLWDRASLKTRLAVFQILSIERKEFPEDKLTGLWKEINTLLSDRGEPPHWGNFAHANKEAIRRLTGTAVQRSLVTIGELKALYDDKPKVNVELELQMLSSSSWQKGLFGPQGQQITQIDALLWLFKDNGLPEEDQEVLHFFDKHCCLPNLNDKPESFADLESILTSSSVIAAPVLATYLLNTLGRSDFTIERLFAIFFCLNKACHYESLINDLHCLATVSQCNSDATALLKSELIAAIILTRCATNVHKATPEQFDIYLDTLASIMKQGHYALILNESSRFIELTRLESEPTEFEFLFKEALEKIPDEQLNTLAMHDLNAIYVLSKRMNVRAERLSSKVSEDMINASTIFDNPVAIEVLAVRSDARKNKLEEIYGAVDAFGYNSNTKSVPGQFHLGSHREPLQSHLFDALALSGPSERDQVKSRIALTAELAPLLCVERPCSQLGNHRGSQLNRISEVKELDGYPGNLMSFYEKLSQSVGSNLLYSKEVLIKLHIEGYTPEDVIQCGRSYFVLLRSGDMTIFGEVNNQDKIFALLDEFRPKTVTNVSVYSMELNTMIRDDYPHGSLLAEHKVISLQPDTTWDKEVLEEIRDTFKRINVEQYFGKNPLGDIAIRLAPIFDCCGVRFNPDGTDYVTQKAEHDHQFNSNQLEMTEN